MKYKIGLVEHSLVVPEDISVIPLGTILPYSANTLNPPAGFLFCDGSAISRSMYPDLFALIGTLYGSGDGLTTFNLPNLIGRFAEGGSSAGISKDAGLPNISGFANPAIPCNASAGLNGASVGSAYGSLYTVVSSSTGYYFSPGGTITGTTSRGLYFDASRSSVVYGNSDTVQPSSLTVRYIIKVFSTVSNESAIIDVSNITSDIATRLQRQQIPAFNNKVILNASGTYTVPYTGWYRITIQGGGGGGGGGSSQMYGLHGGGGGGQGGYYQFYKYLEKDVQLSYTIGAGGTGGTGKSDGTSGTSGGETSITIGGNTYRALGGQGGSGYGGAGYGGEAGAVKIDDQLIFNVSGMRGTDGGSSANAASSYHFATAGNGGGIYTARGAAGRRGSGGYGGTCYQVVSSGSYSYNDGYAGGSGYIELEYFDPSL